MTNIVKLLSSAFQLLNYPVTNQHIIATSGVNIGRKKNDGDFGDNFSLQFPSFDVRLAFTSNQRDIESFCGLFLPTLDSSGKKLEA